MGQKASYSAPAPGASAAQVIEQSGKDVKTLAVLVTGGTTGIGLHVAQAFRNAGSLVAVAARSVSDPSSASCDFANWTTVHNFVTKYLPQVLQSRQLNLVFLNAGVRSRPFQLTEQGVEMTYQVNFAAQLAMLHLLIDNNMLASDCRVVFTHGSIGVPFGKSEAHFAFQPDPKHFSNFGAIIGSKHMMLMCLDYYSKQCDSKNKPAVQVFCVDPGPTRTSNVQELSGLSLWMMKSKMAEVFAGVHEAPQGAARLVWTALTDDLSGCTRKNVTSKYHVEDFPSNLDKSKEAALWETTEKVFGLAQMFQTKNESIK